MTVELTGNQSIGYVWVCSMKPKGIVREVSARYVIDPGLYPNGMPPAGTGGKYVFTFEPVSMGEAELTFTLWYRGAPSESGETKVYKAVVDTQKKLTICFVETLYLKVKPKGRNAREERLREIAKTAEKDAREELKSGETLLCLCTLKSTGKAVAAVFMLLMGIAFLMIFNLEIFGISWNNDIVGIVIRLLLNGLFAVPSIITGVIYLKESRFNTCFITNQRICFRGKKGLIRDIHKENVREVIYSPVGKGGIGGTKNNHSFITFRALDGNGRKKRYQIAPLTNAAEIARILKEVG